PVGRIRQPRQFPAVIPHDPSVFLIWPDDAVPGEIRPVLDRLCAKVTYLGHSATPVQVWVDVRPPQPTLLPAHGKPAYRLRVFGPGRYDDLRNRYEQALRPLPRSWQGYSVPASPSAQPPARSSFDDELIVLRQVDGRRFSLESTLQLGQALRNTLMSR